MNNTPTLRLLSLGAGVQSTTISLLIAEGRVAPIDAAIFADTQSEPADVYRHLDRLEHEVLAPAGIPVHRVTEGCLTDDALDPEHRFASMPLYVKNQDGGDGMMRRQCTAEYKLKPIKKQVRALLGYPHPAPVPGGVFAEMLIGFSLDEVGRVRDSTGTGKTHTAYAALRLYSESVQHADWKATSAAALLGDLRPAPGRDTEAALNAHINASLLLLDDLGAAKSSEWVEEVLYRIIDARYNNCLPTIFATNVASPDELATRLGERTASRLTEMCRGHVIVLKGADRRRAA